MEEYRKLMQEYREIEIKLKDFFTACDAKAVSLGLSGAMELMHDNKELDEEMENILTEGRLSLKRMSDYREENKERMNREEAAQAKPMTLRQMIDDIIRTNRALAKFEQKHAEKHPKGKASDCNLCMFEFGDLDTDACQARSIFDKHSIDRPAEWWTLTHKKPKS